MSIPKSILLLILFQTGHETLFAQKIIDSIKVCEYPVREGIVYQYDRGSFLGSLCGGGREEDVSILTKYDSVFHIGGGEVIGIHFYVDGCAIIIRTEKDEYVSYSNLKTSTLFKGDAVMKGTFLGLAGKSEEGNYQQVNFMFFKKNSMLSFKKTVEYIRCKISCEQTKGYIL